MDEPCFFIKVSDISELFHHGKWNKLVTIGKNAAWFHLRKVSSIVKFTEKESRIVVSRDWEEREMRSYGLMGIMFQFCNLKIFWRLAAQQREYT